MASEELDQQAISDALGSVMVPGPEARFGRMGLRGNMPTKTERDEAIRLLTLKDIERRIIAAAWDYNDLNIADDREILDRLSALVSEYRAAGGSRPGC